MWPLRLTQSMWLRSEEKKAEKMVKKEKKLKIYLILKLSQVLFLFFLIPAALPLPFGTFPQDPTQLGHNPT